jgi:flagellar protein FlaI
MLIVGEVRGQEAYVLFQALATGHGGMCTMHAEDLHSAVKRLTQKPMDISPAYIPLMNVVLSVQRVHILKGTKKKAFRRVITVSEIENYDNYHSTFQWKPVKDEHSMNLAKSPLLSSVAEKSGSTMKAVVAEIKRRQNILHWMRENNTRSYKDVASIIAEYYARPEAIVTKIAKGGKPKVVTSRNH